MTPALHPSCMLNEDWKFYLKPPSAAYQKFFIRFTCNGHIPVIPYYKLKVGFGADEAISVTAYSSTSKPDLAGPFTNSEMLSEAYAYLYYYRQEGSNRTLFSHWYEVESDWDYASAFKVMDGSCGYVDNYQYLFNPRSITPVAGCDSFVKRAEWKKNLTNLFTLTPTDYEEVTEISFIDKYPYVIFEIKLYPVFSINFDNLCNLWYTLCLKSNPTWFVPGYYPPIPLCDAEVWTSSCSTRISSEGTNISEVDVWAKSSPCSLIDESLDGYWYYADLWGDYYTGYYMIDQLESVIYVSSFSGGNKQFIISDSNGNSPSFTQTSVSFNRLYIHIKILKWLLGDITDVCESFNQLVVDWRTDTWELILTPASYF